MTADQPRLRVDFTGTVSALLVGLVAFSLLLFVADSPPVVGSVTEPGVRTIVTIVSLSVLLLLPVTYAALSESDILNPLVLMTGVFFLYFPMSAFAHTFLGLGYSMPGFRANAATLLGPLTTVMILMILGVLGMYAGYAALVVLWRSSNLNRRIEAMVHSRTEAYRMSVPFGVIVPMWLGSLLLYRIKLAGFQPGNAVVGNLSLIHIYVVPLVTAKLFHDHRFRERALPYFLFLGVEIVGITYGQIEHDIILTGVIGWLVSFHYFVHRLSVRDISVTTFVVLASFPITATYERIQDQNFELARALQGYSDSIAQRFIEDLSGRMIGTQSFTLVVDKVPEEVAFRGGETLLWVPLSIVPRIVWPGKPTINTCAQMNMYFSGRGTGTGTCAAMPLPAEFYWNFGASGVVLGMAVVGMVLAGTYYLWLGTKDTALREFTVLTYSIALVNLLTIESGAAEIFSGMFKRSVFVTVILYAAVLIYWWLSER